MYELTELQSFVPRATFPICRSQQRQNHTVADDLPDSIIWRERGIFREEQDGKRVNLYSVNGFAMAWQLYQQNLLNFINQDTAGKTDEQLKLRDIVDTYSAYPEKAQLFNHASAALNNEFYFRGITQQHTEPSQPLREKIENSFSSMDSFRKTFLYHAYAMFGPGFVWLVQDNETDELRILVTYIAGSPYPSAHAIRAASHDMANQPPQPQGGRTYRDDDERRRMTTPQNSVRSRPEEGNKMSYDSEPILCVNTWEHAWIRDFGLKKAHFLARWWDFINWDRVSKLSKNIQEGRKARSGQSGRATAEGTKFNAVSIRKHSLKYGLTRRSAGIEQSVQLPVDVEYN